MPNSVGLQGCYWWGTEVGDDIHAIVDSTARVGADHIELNPSMFLGLSKGERGELKKRIGGHGLGITVNGSMMTPDAYLTSDDPAVACRGFERAREILEACAEFGSPVWTGVMHGLWNARPDGSNLQEGIAHAREKGLVAVRKLARLAAPYRVTICLEVVNRYEFFFLNTAADGVRFCEAVNSPWCRLLLDTFHMSIEEDNTAEALQHAQERGQLGCLHVGESNRRLPTGGKTNIHWQDIGNVLKHSGYNGAISLEPFVFSAAKNAGATCTWRDQADPHGIEAIVRQGQESVHFIKSLLKP